MLDDLPIRLDRTAHCYWQLSRTDNKLGEESRAVGLSPLELARLMWLCREKADAVLRDVEEELDNRIAYLESESAHLRAEAARLRAEHDGLTRRFAALGAGPPALPETRSTDGPEEGAPTSEK